jgi:YD repeat-containing protein
LISVTNPLDGTITYSYNGDNDLLSITDPLDQTTSYGYDLDGEETSVTTPNGDTTDFGYDALGRVDSETLPSIGGGSGGGPTTYTYRSFAATKGLVMGELRLAA